MKSAANKQMTKLEEFVWKHRDLDFSSLSGQLCRSESAIYAAYKRAAAEQEAREVAEEQAGLPSSSVGYDTMSLIQQKKDGLRQAVRDWAASRDFHYGTLGMTRVYPSYAAAREVAKEARNLGLKARAVKGTVFALYPVPVPAPEPPPPADSLKVRLDGARSIIIDAFCLAGSEGKHAPDCEAGKFAKANRHCPPAHPVWKSAPVCNCWVGRAAAWLKHDFNCNG